MPEGHQHALMEGCGGFFVVVVVVVVVVGFFFCCCFFFYLGGGGLLFCFCFFVVFCFFGRRGSRTLLSLGFTTIYSSSKLAASLRNGFYVSSITCKCCIGSRRNEMLYLSMHLTLPFVPASAPRQV